MADHVYEIDNDPRVSKGYKVHLDHPSNFSDDDIHKAIEEQLSLKYGPAPASIYPEEEQSRRSSMEGLKGPMDLTKPVTYGYNQPDVPPNPTGLRKVLLGSPKTHQSFPAGDVPIIGSTLDVINRGIQAPISGQSWDDKTADVVEGGGAILGAGLLPEMAANPLKTLASIIPAYGAQQGVQAITGNRLVGDIAGAAVGPGMYKGIKSGVNRVSDVFKGLTPEQMRAVQEIGTEILPRGAQINKLRNVVSPFENKSSKIANQNVPINAVDQSKIIQPAQGMGPIRPPVAPPSSSVPIANAAVPETGLGAQQYRPVTPPLAPKQATQSSQIPVIEAKVPVTREPGGHIPVKPPLAPKAETLPATRTVTREIKTGPGPVRPPLKETLSELPSKEAKKTNNASQQATSEQSKGAPKETKSQESKSEKTSYAKPNSEKLESTEVKHQRMNEILSEGDPAWNGEQITYKHLVSAADKAGLKPTTLGRAAKELGYDVEETSRGYGLRPGKKTSESLKKSQEILKKDTPE